MIIGCLLIFMINQARITKAEEEIANLITFNENQGLLQITDYFDFDP